MSKSLRDSDVFFSLGGVSVDGEEQKRRGNQVSAVFQAHKMHELLNMHRDGYQKKFQKSHITEKDPNGLVNFLNVYKSVYKITSGGTSDFLVQLDTFALN